MDIEVYDLVFSYGARRVLNISHVKFELGNAYGIVGKNGAGKTTFFKALTNIIANYSGEVLIGGVRVKENPHVLWKVGIVLDDMELYKDRTGTFNLRYFGGLRGGFDEKQAAWLAHELEIYDDLNLKVSKYSLGMKKKLILLISLINNAQILIFDEPFRGLDAKTVDWFRNYLLELKNDNRMILISSHVQDDIESISDKVLVLSDMDFIDEFDLNDNTQPFIYSVEVNNEERFIAYLQQNGIPFVKKGILIRFELTEERYRKLFKHSVADNIEFYQIKKESKFSEFVQ